MLAGSTPGSSYSAPSGGSGQSHLALAARLAHFGPGLVPLDRPKSILFRREVPRSTQKPIAAHHPIPGFTVEKTINTNHQNHNISMTPIVWTYLSYLAISIALTIWVAKTLHKNGRIFLVDAFGGNEPLADSVNHLLVGGLLPR